MGSLSIVESHVIFLCQNAIKINTLALGINKLYRSLKGCKSPVRKTRSSRFLNVEDGQNLIVNKGRCGCIGKRTNDSVGYSRGSLKDVVNEIPFF